MYDAPPPTQRLVLLESVKMTFFGERGFVGIIWDLRMRPCRVRVGPTANDKCPYYREDKKKRKAPRKEAA